MKLGEFIELRASLGQRRIGQGGRDLCEALTSALDEAVREIVPPFGSHDSHAVVAIGGYGRAELSPFSDVDLMILHDTDDPAPLAAEVFRPLWDARLRVGHAVRTVDDVASAARDNLETQTTLLTSRLIAGSGELYDEMVSRVADVTRARPLRRHLVAAERDRREVTPFLAMATNVKTGRGGLRTLQGFKWERAREALIGRFSNTSPEESLAEESLLRIRNALHVAAGRSYDIYAVDLRDQVARWLDLDVFESAKLLVGAMQTVDRLASRRWPEVTEPARRRRTTQFKRSRRTRVSLESTTEADQRTPTLTVATFTALLSHGERGRLVYERLWDEGELDEVIPDWGVVANLPQLAPFHEHPVAAHLWRTVAEMKRLLDGDGEDHASHITGLVEEANSAHALLLAAFLHDIGKGHGGDHAAIGAGIARSVCQKLGCDPTTTDVVAKAVRHHLLLAETATRRDLDDMGVIREVADTLGELEVLRVVYLLTIADSRATGPTMWSPWKATLLRTLFQRCASLLGGREADEFDLGATEEEVVRLAGDGRTEELVGHLKLMPDRYLEWFSAEDVVWHFETLAGLDTDDTRLEIRFDDPIEMALVVGRWSKDLRQIVAESFAANGIDILEARLIGKADGHVVDLFKVRDDRTGQRLPAGKWAQVEADIRAGLAGSVDTRAKVAERASAYRSPRHPGVPPRVETSVDEATGDVVLTVRCADRVGRMAELLAAIGALGLEIQLAKLDTRAGEALDSFHVLPESVTRQIDEIERSLAKSITP